ncbi:MAG: cell division protein FtsQ/DivIB [Halioglobus sp.]
MRKARTGAPAASDAVDKARSRKPRVVKARPGSDKRMPAKPGSQRTRTRKPSHGATRNAREPVQLTRKPSVWFNRLLILLGAGVVLLAAVQAYITLQSIPVQRISVTGELEYTQTAVVQELVQPELAGGFLKADLQRIRTQLEGLPWIYEATVRRKWPNALEINVVEQLPIARWGDDGFLNHEGEIFHSGKAGQWQSLPQLQGPDGTARSLMDNYQRLLEILAPLGLALEQLAVDERGQVEAVLAGGITLVVGSEDFLERMQRFVAIYHAELAPRAGEIERIDLRYESGIAVAFTEPPQMAGVLKQ